jgi:anti-anti-sigma factor
MTAVHSLTTAELARPRRDDDVTVDCGRAEVRAHCSPLATVLTINGDVDANSIDRITACVTEVMLLGNSFLLDLSGVDFFAAQSISVLVAVDDALRGAGLPWVIVTSSSVDHVLRISEQATLPTAGSVRDAMQYFALLSRMLPGLQSAYRETRTLRGTSAGSS